MCENVSHRDICISEDGVFESTDPVGFNSSKNLLDEVFFDLNERHVCRKLIVVRLGVVRNRVCRRTVRKGWGISWVRGSAHAAAFGKRVYAASGRIIPMCPYRPPPAVVATK